RPEARVLAASPVGTLRRRRGRGGVAASAHEEDERALQRRTGQMARLLEAETQIVEVTDVRDWRRHRAALGVGTRLVAAAANSAEGVDLVVGAGHTVAGDVARGRYLFDRRQAAVGAHLACGALVDEAAVAAEARERVDPRVAGGHQRRARVVHGDDAE